MKPRVRTFEGSSPFWPAVPLPTRRPEPEPVGGGRRRAVLTVVEERAHQYIRVLAADKDGFLVASAKLGLAASDRLEQVRTAILADAAGFLPRIEWAGAEGPKDGEVVLLEGLVLLSPDLVEDPDRAVRLVLSTFGRHLRNVVRSAAYLGPASSTSSPIALYPRPSAASHAGEALMRTVERLGQNVVGGFLGLRRQIATGVEGAARASTFGRWLEAGALGLGGVLRGLEEAAGGVAGGLGTFLGEVLAIPSFFFGGAGRRFRELRLSPVAVGLERVLRAVARVGPNFVDRFSSGVLTFLGGAMALPQRPGEGRAALGRGLAQFLLQAPVDSLHELVASAASGFLVTLGYEPQGRVLTVDEIVRFRRIYGESLNLDRVRIVAAGRGIGALGDGAAFTVGYTIYLADRGIEEALGPTMHRIWRYQNGGIDSAAARRVGRAMSDARAPILWSRLPQARFETLSSAEQATLLMLAERSGFFESAGAAACLLLPRPGGAPTDLTEYMAEAWELLRRGLGAR